MYLNDYTARTNSTKKERISFPTLLIAFVFVYALFGLDRIKKISFLKIDGMSTTNEIWLILLVWLICGLYNRAKGHEIRDNKYIMLVKICLYLLVTITIIGGFHAISTTQYVYAVLLFLVPSLLFFITSKLQEGELHFLLKLFVVTSLIYSLFAIVLTTNYAFFMRLIGNPVDNYRYYGQYRASMMLGSSITVSYYFNLTLPLCFYSFYHSPEKKWKKLSAFAVGANVVATLVLLSRNANFVMVGIVVYCLFFMSKTSRVFGKTVISMFLLITAGLFATSKYDLSRLLIGLDRSGSSVALRLEATQLALVIFKEKPIFGYGMGRFFTRVYHDRFITFNGVTGLVDPHNLYVLVLSELGTVGLFILMALIFVLTKGFSNIQERALRQASYLTLAALLICSLGGSHLVIAISYATIFWVYMGMYSAFCRKRTGGS